MVTGKITPQSLLHQNKKKTKTITLDNILDLSSTDNVSDAMKNLYGIRGVIEGIKPINPNSKLVGKIKTVDTDSYDWGTGVKAIYESKPGEILFINCSDTKHAVWGELASKSAQKNGLIGTVVNGASRDTPEVIKSEYPVFSKEIRPNAGLPSNNGKINERLVVNDYVIENGDILIGDQDGVVVIPKEKLDEVLTEVNNIKKFESDLIKKITKEDAHLDELVGL